MLEELEAAAEKLRGNGYPVYQVYTLVGPLAVYSDGAPGLKLGDTRNPCLGLQGAFYDEHTGIAGQTAVEAAVEVAHQMCREQGLRPTRPKLLTAGFRTRAEVDAEVARLEAIAERWEARRDATVHEGPDYWRSHDRAMIYVCRIRELLGEKPPAPGRHRNPEAV